MYVFCFLYSRSEFCFPWCFVGLAAAAVLVLTDDFECGALKGIKMGLANGVFYIAVLSF